MIDIPDFVPHAPMPRTSIDAYRDRVPGELVDIWAEHGLGSFANGFLRVIDPVLYADAIGERIGKVTGDGVAVPIMATALGDLITWEDDRSVVAILYRSATTTGLGSRLTSFLTPAIRFTGKHLSRTLAWQPYLEAVALHGELPYDESFIFTPLPALGGPGTVDTLLPGKTISAIQVAIALLGPIEH
ncbi:hypothetical protein IWX78_002699 [Mycetocola sp. CAN_C7]|uniref:GAD-like domain-containing protein n=1 Tax=Mycetocola sp. CAN_C7 TaxID=2787724 RepID=UPI0018C99A65